jgi:hypothetical protein
VPIVRDTLPAEVIHRSARQFTENIRKHAFSVISKLTA